MDDFADRIRERRKDLGLTQAELAERVGRSPSAVGAWERGRSHPSDDVLETLTHVLDLDAIEASEQTELEAAARAAAGAEASAPAVQGPEDALRSGPGSADTPDREPVTSSATSDGEEAEAVETEMDATESTTTLVVAKSRRVASRIAGRLGGGAGVATVQPIRTDVDPMYRVRALATAGVVVMLAAVFVWAVGHFAAEFSEILDAFLAPWR